ncbi:MAG: hypothetical protein H7A42_08220 [Chlamydiales bacterium]|nr:hypothetical protein [Chlamydiales bacterium]
MKPFRQTTIAFDIGRIYNSDVQAFGNAVYIKHLKPHGSNGGAGFGWNSTTVYKWESPLTTS